MRSDEIDDFYDSKPTQPPEPTWANSFAAEEAAEERRQKIDDEAFHIEQCCLGKRRDVRRNGTVRERDTGTEVMEYMSEDEDSMRALILAVLAPDKNVFATERAAIELVKKAVRAFAEGRVG